MRAIKQYMVWIGVRDVRPIMNILPAKGHPRPSSTCNKQKQKLLWQGDCKLHAFAASASHLTQHKHAVAAAAPLATLTTLTPLSAFNGPVQLEGHPVRAHWLFSMRCRREPYRRRRGCVGGRGEWGRGYASGALRCTRRSGPVLECRG